MCLYPRLITNKKYKPNKKNGGQVPPVIDNRTRFVPIGCQNCMECRKQKSREWQARLTEDIKTNKNAYFVTLTFSNESIAELSKEITNAEGYELDNATAIKAVRLFLERWRKKHRTSARHWFITELGHQGTENIHIHGIIWDKIKWNNQCFNMKLKHYWSYGFVWTGEYVNTRTVNYIIKYVTKVDEKHKYYKSRILASPGIGHLYSKTSDGKRNEYDPGKTQEFYRTTTGNKINIPVYWRNKIYTDEEKEKLWIEKLDKQTRWVLGKKIDVSKGMDEYYKILKIAQEKNNKLGYGSNMINWTQEEYEKEQRKLRHKERIEKIRKE